MTDTFPGLIGFSEGLFDQRPILIAVAGPNGAGRSTFYQAHLRPGGLPFVNADVLAAGLKLDAYAAAKIADRTRRELVDRGESFVFETVFSDPAGEKIGFLKDAALAGYTVILLFIGISGPELSDTRVAMRVAQGGHDVPQHKLVDRYLRSLRNLRFALSSLEHVYIIDNSNLRQPFRLIAHFESGVPIAIQKPVPLWLAEVLDQEGSGESDE